MKDPNVGWRVFSLAEDGATLRPPFMVRYHGELVGGDDDWQPGINKARCFVSDHLAPARDCSCGLRVVVGLPEFLAAVGRPFANTPRSVFQECGVLARAALSGLILPGYNIPVDDPESTNRGQFARLLDVHLAPPLAQHAAAVEARYNVAVTGHTPQSWADLTGATVDLEDRLNTLPQQPTPDRDAFVRAVGQLPSFGNRSTAQPEQYLELGDAVAAGLRAGASIYDAVVLLFDMPARPSLDQQLAGSYRPVRGRTARAS